MTDSPKNLLDLAVDALSDGLRKAAAHTGAKVVRAISKEAGSLAAELEKESLCECTPIATVRAGGGRRARTVLTHQKGCPAAT